MRGRMNELSIIFEGYFISKCGYLVKLYSGLKLHQIPFISLSIAPHLLRVNERGVEILSLVRIGIVCIAHPEGPAMTVISELKVRKITQNKVVSSLRKPVLEYLDVRDARFASEDAECLR
jgi:hypothetical protein